MSKELSDIFGWFAGIKTWGELRIRLVCVSDKVRADTLHSRFGAGVGWVGFGEDLGQD